MVLTPEYSVELLTLMVRSRLFEEKIEELTNAKLIHGTTHLAIGQEAVHGGVSPALEKEDWIVTTHRCHGHALAKGSPPENLLAEFFGLRQGVAKGLGGSMHLIDLEQHNAGSSAVVGSSVALAAGIALQLKRMNSTSIVVAFFGDGASSRGIVHETMNMASIWGLPLLFLCEHNYYGMSSKAQDMVSVDSLSTRGVAYSIESCTVDGNDLEAVWAAVKQASTFIRQTGRPYLLEAQTYRLAGHSKNDNCHYRSREEEEEWRKRDPIDLFKERLFERHVLDVESYHQIVSAERENLDSIVRRLIKESDTLSLDEAFGYVYAQEELL